MSAKIKMRPYDLVRALQIGLQIVLEKEYSQTSTNFQKLFGTLYSLQSFSNFRICWEISQWLQALLRAYNGDLDNDPNLPRQLTKEVR